MAQEKQQPAPYNRDVEAFLVNVGSLEIDKLFGLNEYFRYLEDVQLRVMGFSFEELGIAERRHSCNPKMLVPAEGPAGTFRFVDRWNVYDTNETQPGSIALLKLQGVMRAQSGLSSPGVDRMVSDLRAAYANQNVDGIIIETNSGGGESMAGTMLKSAILERNKPVVGFAHLAASAAYRALSGADEILGSGPSSEFGSIGTMVTLDAKMLSKYKERFMDFYGKDAPEKNGDFRAVILDDFSKIQNRVDTLTEAFQAEIKRDRNLQGDAATIKETLNGSVWNAIDSKKRGLVDMIGTMQTAVKRVKALRGKYK